MTDGRSTNRREIVVDAARRAFTANGYDGTSIGSLAGELGISKAAIGYYFPAKETFLDELLTPLLNALDSALDAATDATSALSGYLSVLTLHHDIAVWMDTDPFLKNHSVHGARLSEINQRTLAIISGGIADDRELVMALTALGGVWRPVLELPTAVLVEHHEEIIEAALAGHP